MSDPTTPRGNLESALQDCGDQCLDMLTRYLEGNIKPDDSDTDVPTLEKEALRLANALMHTLDALAEMHDEPDYSDPNAEHRLRPHQLI